MRVTRWYRLSGGLCGGPQIPHAGNCPPIESIVCPGSGNGAQVYGHYTVNSVTRYWQINVNAGGNGAGTFQITAVWYNGATYTSPTIAVNSTIQCS
jgi:hypothetical protein